MKSPASLRLWSRLLNVALIVAMIVSVSPPVGTTLAGKGEAMSYQPRSAISQPPPDTSDSPPPFRLSEGDPDFDPILQRLPRPETEPLNEADLLALLSRLPAVDAQAEDEQEYRLPVESLPAPRPGGEIDLAFPPEAPETAPPDADPSAPLAVRRYAPEGDVPLIPQLSVTFNQPMVPLSSHAELDALDVPVTLTPAVPGRWRWVGTTTLFFEVADAESGQQSRFPMATEFTATIPAGIVSANGSSLDEAVTWSFRTPPPTLEASHPQGRGQPLTPLIFARFDQQIDADAVLGLMQVRTGREDVAVRPATPEEIEADGRVQRLVESSQPGRFLVVRPVDELPTDSTVTVTFPEGMPSAEGPRLTERSQSFSFNTYGPFVVTESRCGWNNECPPFTPWEILFSNPLDAAAFDLSQIEILPDLGRVEFDLYDRYLTLRGTTQGRTTYQVTLPASLQDIYGQRLGEPVTLTFNVGSANPYLTAPGGNLTLLEPSPNPVYNFYAMNMGRVRVRAYAVQAEQYIDYLSWMRDEWRSENPAPPPGRLVYDEQMTIQSEPDQLTEVGVELAGFLDGERGSVILRVEPVTPLLQSLINPNTARRLQSYAFHRFIQVTEIGLGSFVDAGQMVVWASRMTDGAPLADVHVTLWPTGIEGVTDESGLARLRLPNTSSAPLILARMEGDGGVDQAVIPYTTYYYYREDGWRRQNQSEYSRFFVFDDRALYRPGETVSLKGWMRTLTPGPSGDVTLPVGAGLSQVTYRVMDPRGNVIDRGSLPMNAAGGFHLQFPIPENVNLGSGTVELMTAGGNHYHSFQIQEFRRPEFEVRASASEGPHLVGENAVATVKASYFAGGPLPAAEVEWEVTARSTSYQPPNWSGFTFGRWVPWWRFYGGYESGTSWVASFSSRTNAAGEHHLGIAFDAPAQPYPFTLSAEATVFDVNRQAWSGGTNLLVHPGDRYVGLRSDRYFVERGQPIPVEVAVTDIDGQAQPGVPVTLRAERLDWEFAQGEWVEVVVESQTCDITTSDAVDPRSGESEFATCEFRFDLGGQIRITATVVDESGRPNQTELTRWIGGGQRPPSREVEQEEVLLIPSAERYQPGDVAEILVQSPFPASVDAPAQGLLTLRRDGLVSEERFTMTEGTVTLQIPIEESYLPNITVQVDLVGQAPRLSDAGEAMADVPPRPAYATGSLTLEIPPLVRTLSVDAVPAQSRLSPGEETSLRVRVTDADGQPVSGAEMAVVVVDESVLALTGYQLADPVSVFYSGRGSGVSDHHNRGYLLLMNPELSKEMVDEVAEQAVMRSAATPTFGMPAPMAAAESAPDMAYDGMMMESPAMEAEAAGDEGAPIQVRTNFDALALFAPEVETDDDGEATLTVTLPDNLTRYRIMVVAVSGENRFGSGEANLTARLPLMVRPSAPRFLNFGDRFELPVVLQNQTDAAMLVDVALQATNAALPDASAILVMDGRGAAQGQRVTVPANDRVEVRFETTTRLAGTARFQFAGVSGGYADAAEVSLPVYTPATTEAFAVYGELDDSITIAQPILPPADVIPVYGGLEVALSSTAVQALTDAYLYLVEYPFECSEQIASRILAMAALRDVLTAFDAAGLPPADEIDRAMARDIEILSRLQASNGGFPIWRQGGDLWPYYGIHGAHALFRAEMKGYSVPAQTISRSLDYLRNIESHIPAWYGQRSRDSLTAYALYVRNLRGDVDTAAARGLIERRGLENLPLESVGWLLNVLTGDPGSESVLAQIRRHLDNRVSETAAAANFVESYGDNAYLILHSSRRTDGVILDALMADQPESDLIPKLVRGLLNHRTAGRWQNTQENVWVLLALDRYFNQYESQTPDFVARVWLGDQYAGAQTFEGRTTETTNLAIPMQVVQDQRTEDGATVPLLLQKEGDGRLYYRLGMRYAPTDLTLDPAEYGFTVERVYEPVDDPGDVVQEEDGSWTVKAGSRVRVRITMVAPDRRYHVALMDPLPAGFEAINPALAVSGSLPGDPSELSPYRWWWGPWYEHQNLRDQRVEAFASLVWGGVYEYTYVARATTLGDFIAPPAKAEEMYTPETFGRSGTDRVRVVE